MFNSILEVAKATQEKYKDATALSRNPDSVYNTGGYYSHKYNGIGCAIGCHLTPEVGDECDDASIDGGSPAVETLLHDSTLRPSLAEVFDLGAISLTQFQRLQSLHDKAANVPEFRYELGVYIASLTDLEAKGGANN